MRPTLRKMWMVWGKHKGLPNVTHSTKEKATLEAWRLAVKNPNRSFVVMEAVDVRKFTTEDKRLDNST